MTLTELQRLYDREQRIEIEYPDLVRESLPQVVRYVRTTEPRRGFIRYAWLDDANPAELVHAQMEHFRAQGISFEWMVCEHDASPGLIEQLLAHGFEPDLDPGDPGAVLVLDLGSAPASLLASPHRTVRRIQTTAELADVQSVLEGTWGRPFEWIPAHLGRHLAVPGYLSVFLSEEAGQPVCTGWTYYPPNSQFASLWGGSTLPAFRRRGHYTALLAARVQEALRRGRRYLLIYAGLESRPIVEKHGFQVLTYACSYEWELPKRDLKTI